MKIIPNWYRVVGRCPGPAERSPEAAWASWFRVVVERYGDRYPDASAARNALGAKLAAATNSPAIWAADASKEGGVAEGGTWCLVPPNKAALADMLHLFANQRD